MAEVELPKPEELHEKAENRFSRRVALVTAVFAVVLAIAALGGNHAMKEMLLSQQQSSDQWAFYQAAVIREHLYRGQKLSSRPTSSSVTPPPPEARKPGAARQARGGEALQRREGHREGGEALSTSGTASRLAIRTSRCGRCPDRHRHGAGDPGAPG
jgi:hypothetical protein